MRKMPHQLIVGREATLSTQPALEREDDIVDSRRQRCLGPLVRGSICFRSCVLALTLSGCGVDSILWSDARVVVGDGFVAKSTFIDVSGDHVGAPANIANIQLVQRGDSEAKMLAIVEGANVRFVDLTTRETLSAIMLEQACVFPSLVDVEGDGLHEVMCRGGAIADVGLQNASGSFLWVKGGSLIEGSQPLWMAAGDLNGDGILEFCAVFGGAFGGSLACFDEEGTEIWKSQLRYTHVEMRAQENDQEGQVVAHRVGAGSQILEFLDASGNLITSETLPSRGTREFRLVDWGESEGGYVVVMRAKFEVLVLGADGRVIFRSRVPGMWNGNGIEATLVRFNEGEASYLAALVGLTGDRSVLSLFSLSGELVYRETLGGGSGLLAAKLNDPDPSGETLLVSDSPGKIVAYRRP